MSDDHDIAAAEAPEDAPSGFSLTGEDDMGATGAPRLVEALADLRSWRAEAEHEIGRNLEEIQREDKRLRDRVQEIERQLVALESMRAEVRERADALDGEEASRSHELMVSSLADDKRLLATRSSALEHARREVRAEAEALLADPELAETVAEYERYTELEAGLASLPESYRHAIVAHHEQVKRRLAPVFEKAAAKDVVVNLPGVSVGIVACLESTDGQPESLTLVLPVDRELYTDWAERGDELGTVLALRMVELATKLVAALGADAAPLTYRELGDCLTIEIWLADHELADDPRFKLEALLEQGRGVPGDLGASRVHLHLIWLDAEVLAAGDVEVEAVAVRAVAEED